VIEYFASFYLYVNEAEKYGFFRKKKKTMLYCFLRKRERNHQLSELKIEKRMSCLIARDKK